MNPKVSQKPSQPHSNDDKLTVPREGFPLQASRYSFTRARRAETPLGRDSRFASSLLRRGEERWRPICPAALSTEGVRVSTPAFALQRPRGGDAETHSVFCPRTPLVPPVRRRS